ncbi:Alpha/Beta hydrolase protein [Trichoderma compactum]
MHFVLQLSLALTVAAGALPKPSGPFKVGYSDHIILHDTPNDPTPGPGNELLAHFYYPTDDKVQRTVPYFDEVAADLWGGFIGLPDAPSLLNLSTALIGNASYLQAPTGRPTILFSPGGGVPAWMYYGLLADLASHGYAIVAIEHPGEPPSLRWPNGTQTIGWDLNKAYTSALDDEIAAYHVTDLNATLSWFSSFVSSTGAPFSTSQYISLGHSIGGGAAVSFAAVDQRLQAVVNLDGIFRGNEVVVTDVGRPVFLMTSINHTTAADPSWKVFEQHQTGWWQSVSVYGSGHLDYSDITSWNSALGFSTLVQTDFGFLGGVRMTHIIQKYVRDFLAFVAGSGKGVLAGPSLEWREVIYVGGNNH